MGTIGLVVIFLIIVVGGFSYAYLQRAKELEQYTKHHLDQIAIGNKNVIEFRNKQRVFLKRNSQE